MLKFLFVMLLLANALLFGYHQGYLDSVLPDGREPERLYNQLNQDRIKKLAAPMPGAAATAMPAEQPSCMEIGNFSQAHARQLEPQLAALVSADKISRREVQETSSHMVLIPPQASKADADKKAAELRKLEISDFFVIQDSSDHRWGISLGVFRTEEAARAQLAALQQKGVKTAQVVEHKVPFNRVAFQLRGLDAGKQVSLEKARIEFPRHEVRSCE